MVVNFHIFACSCPDLPIPFVKEATLYYSILCFFPLFQILIDHRNLGLFLEKKLCYIHTTEYYTAESKKELLPFAAAWMYLESIMLSEISQAVRDKYHMISPVSGT